MRLPLVVFVLILVAAQAVRAATDASDGPSAGRWAALAGDLLATFVPFAALALLLIAFGKPGLLAQYAAWAVLALQALRSLALWRGSRPLARALGVLIALLLFAVGVSLLPFFDPLPV
jgi:uncharacterized MAPEG superfamily protein